MYYNFSCDISASFSIYYDFIFIIFRLYFWNLIFFLSMALIIRRRKSCALEQDGEDFTLPFVEEFKSGGGGFISSSSSDLFVPLDSPLTSDWLVVLTPSSPECRPLPLPPACRASRRANSQEVVCFYLYFWRTSVIEDHWKQREKKKR